MQRKTVIYHRDSDFEKQMIQLRQAGGRASKAYQKIGEIRNSIELGLAPATRYTRNGETRIKNCKKYELGDGYRLVTVEVGNVVSFCFSGSTIMRCDVESCNNIAMPESSYCYDHDSK